MKLKTFLLFIPLLLFFGPAIWAVLVLTVFVVPDVIMSFLFPAYVRIEKPEFGTITFIWGLLSILVAIYIPYKAAKTLTQELKKSHDTESLSSQDEIGIENSLSSERKKVIELQRRAMRNHSISIKMIILGLLITGGSIVMGFVFIKNLIVVSTLVAGCLCLLIGFGMYSDGFENACPRCKRLWGRRKLSDQDFENEFRQDESIVPFAVDDDNEYPSEALEEQFGGHPQNECKFCSHRW